MRERIYLGRLEELIKNYQFNLPLSLYLRQEFNKRRNMGSRDRKRTREDIFSYFRIGKNYPELGIAERVAIGSFLCNTNRSPESDYILNTHSPFLPEDMSASLAVKLEKTKEKFPHFDLGNIFSFASLVSTQINIDSFLQSFLKQPKLWIRVRQEYKDAVLTELTEKKYSFEISTELSNAISLINSTPVHELKSYEKGFFEIQDINSQRCLEDIELHEGDRWWDACAGSGGKSLALLDKQPKLKIIVSDLRESSLLNLKNRMKKVSQRIEGIHQLDLSSGQEAVPGLFEGILADVPCSGSGTWARSPEILSSFSETSLIEKYIPLQRKIVQNLTKALKPKKYLIYITCSVFRSENEENIRHFEDNFGLKCLSAAYYEGSELGADTMYRAILSKS